MSMLYVMVPAALGLAITALVAFIWAVKTGQFDDPESHAYRMLFDDEPVSTKNPTPESDEHEADDPEDSNKPADADS